MNNKIILNFVLIIALIVMCCCFVITVAGVIVYKDYKSPKLLYSKDKCELVTTSGYRLEVKDVMEFYACDNTIEILDVKEGSYQGIYAIYSFDTYDNSYTQIKIWEDGEDGIADEIDSYPIGEYGRLLAANNTLLNNRYLFFRLVMLGMVPCNLTEGVEEFENLDCYSEKDLETLKKWGGYWLYDAETREFKILFSYSEEEVNSYNQLF